MEGRVLKAEGEEEKGGRRKILYGKREVGRRK